MATSVEHTTAIQNGRKVEEIFRVEGGRACQEMLRQLSSARFTGEIVMQLSQGGVAQMEWKIKVD